MLEVRSYLLTAFVGGILCSSDIVLGFRVRKLNEPGDKHLLLEGDIPAEMACGPSQIETGWRKGGGG